MEEFVKEVIEIKCTLLMMRHTQQCYGQMNIKEGK